MTKALAIRFGLVLVMVGAWAALRAARPAVAGRVSSWGLAVSERVAWWVGAGGLGALGLMVCGLMWVAYYPFKGQTVYDRKFGVVLRWGAAGVLVAVAGAIALGMVYGLVVLWFGGSAVVLG